MFSSPSPRSAAYRTFSSGFAAIVGRARMHSCMVAILLAPMGLAPSAHADEGPPATDSKNCTSSIALCAGGVGGAAAGIITQCQALRKAKKECRVVKRACTKEARLDKKACVDECHDQLGTGQDARECASACRAVKKDTKGGCKEAKTECKTVAVLDYKTPECVAARGAALASVPACVQMVSCLTASGETEAQ